MAVLDSVTEGLKKLEYLSLVSKVCIELESHIGFTDKVLAEFITEIGRDSDSTDEFDTKLKNNGAEMPDYLVRTLFTIIHAILLPSSKSMKNSHEPVFKSFSIADGCFVSLNDFRGKEGLVHVLQMTNPRVTNAKEVVKRDQSVFVKVISLSGQKMSLLMRDVDQDTGKDLLIE
ncbi:hypothetical protein MKX03_032071 [Papaver bracteatum]|nr:hypothetical protein MKX03_032071 [Papaver bracteatum]